MNRLNEYEYTNEAWTEIYVHIHGDVTCRPVYLDLKWCTFLVLLLTKSSQWRIQKLKNIIYLFILINPEELLCTNL